MAKKGRRRVRSQGSVIVRHLSSRRFRVVGFVRGHVRGVESGIHRCLRRQLLDGVWGQDWVGDDRTVDVHVRQLRKKLGDDLALETVWGVGYRLD